MQKFNLILLSTFALVSTFSDHYLLASDQPVIIESSILTLADGSFFNADTIELIRNYQRNLTAIMEGPYWYQGEKYTLAQLVARINSVGLAQSEEIDRSLELAKNAFVAMSEKFKNLFQGSAKQSMIKLIEESCSKRNKMDSMLLRLVRMPGDETKVFTAMVTSLTMLDQLCNDLHIFLDDLVASCPKAQAQFNERLKKWNKIKSLLPKLKTDEMINKGNSMAQFVKYLKIQHLDWLVFDEIDQEKLQQLYTQFIRQKISTNKK